MKERLAVPNTGSPATRAAGSATAPRLASVIGNRAMAAAVAGTTAPVRPRLSPAGVQLQLSTGRAPGGAGSHLARARGGGLGAAAIHASAARGVATPGSALPHAGAIQWSFGRHDISSIQAHVGGIAAASAAAMGAEAYATGNHVVLGRGTDLFTVAHEAAHVVQQRGGVQLKGGVGEASDAYERQADEVASLVVQGRSAEALLGDRASPPAPSGAAAGLVQRKLYIGPRLQPTRMAPADVEARFLNRSGDNTALSDVLTVMASHPEHSYWFQTWEDAESRIGEGPREPAQDDDGGLQVGRAIEGGEILDQLGRIPDRPGDLLPRARSAVGRSAQPRRGLSSVRIGVTSRDRGGVQEYFDRLLVSYGARVEVVVIERFEDVYGVDGLFIPGGMFDLPDTRGKDFSKFPHKPKENQKKQEEQWNERVPLQRRIIDFAGNNRLPILGVCGGSRALAQRVPGGWTQYLEKADMWHNQSFSEPWKAVHPVELRPNSMLRRVVDGGHYRTGTPQASGGPATMALGVNSMHWASSHFGTNSPVDVSARTPSHAQKGTFVIEGWSRSDQPFFTGTQWHPEFAQLGLDDFAGQDEPHRRIMSALGDAAEERRAAIVIQGALRAWLAKKGKGSLIQPGAVVTNPTPRIRIDGLPRKGATQYLIDRGFQRSDFPFLQFPGEGNDSDSVLLSPVSLSVTKRILELDGRDGLRVYFIPPR